MASHWRLTAGADTLDLPDSFTLQSYSRQTEFVEKVLDGADGVVIRGDSRREGAVDYVLSGIIKENTPADADTKLMEIEDIADSREDDLALVNIGSGVSKDVQHVRTVASRDPASILTVTITLRGNITII